MPSVDQSAVRNVLLRRLSPGAFAALAPELEPFTTGRGDRLIARATPLGRAFFLDHGLGSLVATSPEGQRVEAGIFGREGFAPLPLLLGSDESAYDCLIQAPGSGWRMPAAAFRDAIARDEEFRSLLLRFAEAMSVQTSYTALSNAVHPTSGSRAGC